MAVLRVDTPEGPSNDRTRSRNRRRRRGVPLMPDAPAMNDLLGADTPKNWGKWGPDDEVGALNYLDAKVVLRGALFFLQGSTQYDALGHVWYDGQLWNGYDARSTVGGMDKASVLPIAEKGIV